MLRILLTCFGVSLLSFPAQAQAQGDAPAAASGIRAKYEDALKATMDMPDDPSVLMNFATLAIEIGDMEGAISVLERLLLIDADQPAVKLELGVLYYRIGSIAAARAYLEAAQSSASADDETRNRAATYLKEGVRPSGVAPASQK